MALLGAQNGRDWELDTRVVKKLREGRVKVDLIFSPNVATDFRNERKILGLCCGGEIKSHLAKKHFPENPVNLHKTICPFLCKTPKLKKFAKNLLQFAKKVI